MATVTPVRGMLSADDRPPAAMTEEEYLRTEFRPDCDFVDGRIEERNVGKWEHSRVQHILDRIFGINERAWHVFTAPECRLEVAPHRFRVPDVMVMRRGQKFTDVIREAPLLCIEVLSPDDTWSQLRERLDEYLQMGVEHVWCFEPEAREVRRYTAEGFVKVTEPEMTIAGTAICIRVAEVFAILDEE
jgi:Uma2 family endonuclease